MGIGATSARHGRALWLTASFLLPILLVGRLDAQPATEERVVVSSEGWELIGDLRLPDGGGGVPAVLMFNKAAGDRSAYVRLADYLARRGIASLRLDLRGHGGSTNLGDFVPGKQVRDPMIWDAESDVIAAYEYLVSHPDIDARCVGMVGASYSGEEIAEAGRLAGYAQAYVELSPGSFSDESITAIDSSSVPWLFIVSNKERYLEEIESEVRRRSETVEMIILPGKAHASDLLLRHPGLAERIAVWLAVKLRNCR